MTRRLTRDEVSALASDLRALLARIDAGDLTASTAVRYRLQGAVVALGAASGDLADVAAALLDEESDLPS